MQPTGYTQFVCYFDSTLCSWIIKNMYCYYIKKTMLSVVGPICLGLGVIWPVIFISSNPNHGFRPSEGPRLSWFCPTIAKLV